MYRTKPPRKTRRAAALAAGLAALVLLAAPATAHGSEAHGTLTLHDAEDGADARSLSCTFWVRGSGMAHASGELHAVQGLDGPDAHGHVLAEWQGVADGSGAYSFEVGPLTLDEPDDGAVLYATFDGGAHQSTGYTVSYRACGDAETDADAGAEANATADASVTADADSGVSLSLDLCASVGLHAEAQGDGSVEVHAEGLAQEAVLVRSEGDGPAREVARLDAGQRTFVDAQTEAGATYTYRLAADAGGTLCPGVEVTTIPVFPAPLAGGLAAALGVAGYAVQRRRT